MSIELHDRSRYSELVAYDETRRRALDRGRDKVGRHWHRDYCWEVWREGVDGSGWYRAQCVGSITADKRPPRIQVIGKTFGDILREIDKSLDDMMRLNDKGGVEFSPRRFNKPRH